MNDLEKRFSIIEEKLGIVNLENQFEKKEGKWYKASYKSKYLVYAEKLSGHDVLKGYGFCDSGNWNVFTGGYASILKTVEATPQEVKEALAREANRRYKIGYKVECLVLRMPSIITETPYVSTSSSVNALTDCLASGYIYLFQNGVWAKVIEDPTDKFDLHVGLKFTTRYGRHIYEITSIYDIYVSIGWKGIKDRVDYLICDANRFITNGDWKVYEPTDKFAELKEAHKNGAVIQKQVSYGWIDDLNPDWKGYKYRIKPKEEQKTKFHELAYELGITEDYKVDKFVESLTKLSYESELTLEQDIHQLKDKYKQYKFTITIEDNI